MDDKTKYLPLAQVQRMFSDMPDGYNKYLAAYPGIDTDASQHVVVDPSTGAFMVAPPKPVQDEIRAQMLNKQSQMAIQAAQSPTMLPLNSTAAVHGLSRAQMLEQARKGNSNG